MLTRSWQWVLTLIIPLVVSCAAASADTQHTTLTLLAINDVYEITPVRGSGGLAELMTLLQAERATATHHLTTVSGDFLSPSLLSGMFAGKQMIELFNAIGVDAVVFGNHEFDFGPQVTRQRMAESHFVWLGTNVQDADGKPFGGAAVTLTRTFGDLQVGLIGLLTPKATMLSGTGGDVVITPIIPAAKTAVAALKRQGVDVIIALTHLPFALDLDLARQVPEIHVILGGHDHHPITWYEGNTLIHKSGTEARYLGRIDLRIEKHSTPRGQRIRVQPAWRMIPNRDVPPYPAVATTVKRYTTQLADALDRPLGRVITTLDSRRVTVRSRESTMGNLITDALRLGLQADIALINGGGIRGDLLYEPGTVLTPRDILRELPFGNIAVLLEMSGADVLAALEHGLSLVQHLAGRFLQVAGVRFAYDARRPVGQRLRQVAVGGRRLDPAMTYRVATNEYLLRGGDGYTSFGRGKLLVSPEAGPRLTALVIEYITATGSVAPRLEGRIRVRTSVE
jgi:5'-nucleotidase/UDP-sugar diphosphatase